MTFYQPTVETFSWSFWKSKWVHKDTYPSTLIFDDWMDAEKYRHTFVEGLRKEGLNLKQGNYRCYSAKLILSENI